MRPPQKLWQSTVTGAAGDARGDRLQPLLERVVAPELPADQRATGTAMTAARKRMPPYRPRAALRAKAPSVQRAERGRCRRPRTRSPAPGRACGDRRSTSAGRARRRRTSRSRCRRRSSRTPSAPRSTTAPAAGTRRCRTRCLSRSRAPIARQRRVGERAREVACRPDVGPTRARDGEAQGVVDPAARDLVVAGEARQDRRARRRRPTSSRRGAARFERRFQIAPGSGRPAAADPAKRVELVELAGVAVDDQRVPVAVGAGAALDLDAGRDRVRARGRTRRRTRSGRCSSAGPCRRP